MTFKEWTRIGHRSLSESFIAVIAESAILSFDYAVWINGIRYLFDLKNTLNK